MKRYIAALAALLALALTLGAGARPALAAARPFVLTADLQAGVDNTATGTFAITGGFADSGQASETFTITGPAVDGLKTVTGRQGTMTLHFAGNLAPTDNPDVMGVSGTWNLVSGTGAYAGITGQGTLDTTLNVKTGALHAVYTGTADVAAAPVGMPSTGGSTGSPLLWLLLSGALALVAGAATRRRAGAVR